MSAGGQASSALERLVGLLSPVPCLRHIVYADTLTHMTSAGAMLRDARTAARLSIRALAARADVATSTITRIEQGTLDPTYSTLNRLLQATGRTLKQAPLGARRAQAQSTTPPARLADLARAWQGSPQSGAPDWTALRGTIDVLLQHPEHIPAAISEPPRHSRSPVQRALLAALAERLAASQNLPTPGWARQTRPLAREWMPAGTPRLQQAWRAATLPEWRARNITVDEHSLFRHGAPAVGQRGPSLAST